MKKDDFDYDETKTEKNEIRFVTEGKKSLIKYYFI
jgi:hypothetical protein